MLVHVRHNPVYNSFWNEIANFEREIDNAFRHVTPSDVAADVKYAPAIDLIENQNEVVLVAELPGVSKEDVKISVEKDLLIVSGSRKTNALPEKAHWVRNEIRRGEFSRTVKLPKGIQTDNISAELTNGILKVVLPKAPEVKPREIRIS